MQSDQNSKTIPNQIAQETLRIPRENVRDLSKYKICVVPQVHGVGGMVSFLHKFTAGARARGVQVSNELSDSCHAVLVIGGTRQILPLLRLKRRGVRIVQRLDGLNWIHRVRPVSQTHTLRAEYGNLVLAFIRRFVADRIVYQSSFSHLWWNQRFGLVNKPYSLVYNGVDLRVYSPATSAAHLHSLPAYRLLLVEGSLGGGYEMGLENAIRLAEALVARGWRMEVQVVGEVSPALRAAWAAKTTVSLLWNGLMPREQIPELDRAAHLLFSADVHPACPNSVIEAQACGLPVVAFDTGSLTELVTPQTGYIGPYGSNSWKLQPPNVAGLALGAENVLKNWPAFSQAARLRAENVFGLDRMVGYYLDALLG
jgi:glycosyltransferase involved in cell wall biosynthesis